jgi:hypothetical protein
VSREMELARLQAVQDISSALCLAAGEEITKHGVNDPNSWAIVATGFALAVNSITKELEPNFARTVAKLIEPPR